LVGCIFFCKAYPKQESNFLYFHFQLANASQII